MEASAAASAENQDAQVTVGKQAQIFDNTEAFSPAYESGGDDDDKEPGRTDAEGDYDDNNVNAMGPTMTHQ